MQFIGQGCECEPSRNKIPIKGECSAQPHRGYQDHSGNEKGSA